MIAPSSDGPTACSAACSYRSSSLNSALFGVVLRLFAHAALPVRLPALASGASCAVRWSLGLHFRYHRPLPPRPLSISLTLLRGPQSFLREGSPSASQAFLSPRTSSAAAAGPPWSASLRLWTLRGCFLAPGAQVPCFEWSQAPLRMLLLPSLSCPALQSISPPRTVIGQVAAPCFPPH